MAGRVDFQSFAGAGDKGLRNNVISGYQPASRVGEIMNNAFVDQHEFVKLLDVGITGNDMRGDGGTDVEPKPYFHEWATAHPGMIALSRKQRHTHYRGYTAAEHAVPVVVCAAGLKKVEENDFFFSGVVRSSSVRDIDDGQGPKTDEYFTVSLGGVVTMLNNSGDPLCPGDLIEWCFATTKTSSAKRQKSGPRRFAVNKASPTSSKIIGRALSFAKAGESFDLLIKQ